MTYKKELELKRKLLENKRNTLYEQFEKTLMRNTLESTVRKNKVERCDHEFVVLAASPIMLEPKIIECVHCKLTNKFIYLKPKSPENKYFDKYLKKARKINYISEEVLNDNHIHVLYELALKLAKDKQNNEEIFNIMKELHNLENDIEDEYINSVNDTKWLYERYKERKKLSHVLTMENYLRK